MTIQSEWEKAVYEGANHHTLNRLRYHSLQATIARAARLAVEFESAWKQRIEERRAAPHIHFDKCLTLEEYARLYVLNISTWESFVFWRDVRPRPKNNGRS